MPSRADRTALEWALRIIAALAMTWLVIGAFTAPARPGGEILDSRDLLSSLGRWTARPPAETLGLKLEAPLDRSSRDYLRALRANGTSIAWSNESVASIALEAESLEDPAGGAVVRLSGDEGSTFALSDSLGILDSVRMTAPGITLRVPAFSGGLTARAGATQAVAAATRFRSERSVVVLGMAGWESKFTIRALEERGWKVDSRIALAPRLATTQGRPFPLDTARQVAVIALDSSAAAYAQQIHRFVRSGGGLILGDGASSYLQRSAPATVAAVFRPARLSSRGTEFRQLLTFRAIGPLREGAVALEERNGQVTAAAWRVASGRVVQIGYREIWRWRMEGADNAVAEHRNWWARLVAMVAYRSPSRDYPMADPAPLASLVQALGPPTSLPTDRPASRLWPLWLTVFLVSLFAEWLSRRLRGAA
jgi:hypothetical protein